MLQEERDEDVWKAPTNKIECIFHKGSGGRAASRLQTMDGPINLN